MITYWLEPWRFADQGAVINWLAPTGGETVDVFRNGSWVTYAADEVTMPDGTTPGAGTNIRHRVVLSDLDQNTVYEFRFNGGGTVRTFRTLPSAHIRDIVIAQGSDHQQPNHINDSVFRAINALIAAEAPDILVLNGDLVQDSGGQNGGEAQWVEWLSYLQQDIFDATQHVPFCVANLGNHDLNPNSLMLECDNTTLRAEPRDKNIDPCFSPIYLQTLFHTLWDESVLDYHDGYGCLTAGSWFLLIGLDNGFWNHWDVQTAFLYDLLSRFGSTRQHVVAIQHMDPFPSSRDFNTEAIYRPSIFAARDDWHYALQEMGVNWCLVAHEHVFSMSPPIHIPEDHGHVEVTDSQLIASNPADGIRYIGGGSWHSRTGPRAPNNSGEWWNEVILAEHNYPVLTLTSTQQSADAKTWEGAFIVEGEAITIMSATGNELEWNALGTSSGDLEWQRLGVGLETYSFSGNATPAGTLVEVLDGSTVLASTVESGGAWSTSFDMDPATLPGSVTVRASADGFVTDTETVSLDPAVNSYTGINFTLTEETPSTVTRTGTVTRNGSAVQGADVVFITRADLLANATAQTTTDASGEYSAEIPTGEEMVGIALEGSDGDSTPFTEGA